MVRFFTRIGLLWLILVSLASFSLFGETNPSLISATESVLYAFPVVISQDTLFYYTSDFVSFTATERADLATQKINNLLLNRQPNDSLYIRHSEFYSEIFAGDTSLIIVSEIDALQQHTSRDSLATEYLQRLETALSKAAAATSNSQIIRNMIIAFLIILFTFGLNWIILSFSHKFEMLLMKWHEKEHIYVHIFPKRVLPTKMSALHRINLRGLITAFMFFYNGLKLILIVYIIIRSTGFLLRIAGVAEIWNYSPIFIGIFKAISLTIIVYYVLKLKRSFLFKLYQIFNDLKPKIMQRMYYRSFSFISEDKLIDFAKHSIKFVYFLAFAFVIYFYISTLFSFFAFTETWAGILFGFILTPIQHALQALLDYLPNIFIILVILVLIKYLLKIIRFVFKAIENKAFALPGFYSDWAMPTFKIVRFMVIVFALIVIFPYLPGSNSPFFRGITVFIGVLFSLGSTSAIANIIAGVVLTYMRPFKVGDRVKIAETMGDIMEKSLLVTRVRTVKNVDITVPNAMVLSSHIINYSSSSQDTALIVHTTVTMGYETDWRQIHDLLIEAALATSLLLDNPKPFVLQTALDDFYVKYEINAYTKHPEKMAAIYSELHQNIQDIFAREGLELLSTYYSSLRDGNRVNIPKQYIDPNYQKPGFKIEKDD